MTLAISIHLRAGWSLQGVQDRYIRYEAAGDQHVGRTVSGLPVNEEEFAILAPFFASGQEIASRVIEACFPQVAQNISMKKIFLFCLASIVYHEEFLRENLNENHNYYWCQKCFHQDKLEGVKVKMVA